MWRTPYSMLLLMMSDAPRYVTSDELKKRRAKENSGGLGIFQTLLKERDR
jgi:hypothetical protein